jgi:hypothetical protein
VERERWFKIVGVFTIVGAMSALLVVPEVRRLLGLESQNTQSPTTRTEAGKQVMNAAPPQPREPKIIEESKSPVPQVSQPLTNHTPLQKAKASVQITFDPDSVPPDHNRPCGSNLPAWFFTATLTEIAGVGVTITNWTWDYYDIKGNPVGRTPRIDFAQIFDACSSRSEYIPPYGKVCGLQCLDGSNGGSLTLTFSGTDDNGNTVDFRSRRLKYFR